MPTYDESKRYKATSAQQLAAGKGGASLLDYRLKAIMQNKQLEAPPSKQKAELVAQKKVNNTGMPDNLKEGVENLSGYLMDDVKVHYNSDKPAQLQALAYTQGTNIHIAPGEEKYLQHEAWHVVQQKQGRVKPTMQMKMSVNVNDDEKLESEANEMGNKAFQFYRMKNPVHATKDCKTEIVQRVVSDDEIDLYLSEIDKGEFDIQSFIDWQGRIETIKSGYRTMGPEFEFAKLNIEDIPIHVELAKSEARINGLPFVIETDAGNVVELACPPFVVATSMDNWNHAQLRSMIITDKLERTLKGIAENGRANGMTLRGLLLAIAELFKIRLTYSETEDTYKDTLVGSFTKGVAAFTNATFDKSHVSNAQINLKMSSNEIGSALRAGWKGNSPHMFLKNIVNIQLLKVLSSFKLEMSLDEYKNKVAIIAYYLSQIPIMSLQYIVNQVRSAKKTENNESREVNRNNFRTAHLKNQQLLIRLSTIKDYMGFWIKASLNDMMKDDVQIKEMVLGIDPTSIENFMISHTTKMWDDFKIGLEAYSGKDLTAYYQNAVKSIVGNLISLAKTQEITKPHKIGFPRHEDEGASSDLIDYKNGAPFMARQDTYVALEGGHLVEIRGLNKRIYSNPYMRGFQMPYYRKFKLLANKYSTDFYPKNKGNKRKRDSV